MAKEHVLYRIYGQEKELLYVGVTCGPRRRMKEHSADKGWWSDVADIELEHFESREKLEAAEAAAIEKEKPRHNKIRGVAKRIKRRVESDLDRDEVMGKWFVGEHDGREVCGYVIGSAGRGMMYVNCPELQTSSYGATLVGLDVLEGWELFDEEPGAVA